MPVYEYACPGCGTFEVLYKSLPSEKKQNEAPCPDCDQMGTRLLSNFAVNGTQQGGIEKDAAFGMTSVDVGGRMRPAFRDNNGQIHEAKTSRDVDRWMKDNKLGVPRMVEWVNPKTGQRSMVTQRVTMKADPISGEPMDAPIVRESERLIPLDKDHFVMPTEMPDGRKVDPTTGIPKQRFMDAPESAPISVGGRRVVDPQTGKPFTKSDFWGSPVKSADQGKDSAMAEPGKLQKVHKELRKINGVPR